MAAITHVFGDAITGKVLSEISCYGVSMSRQMNDGEWRGSFQFDQTGKDNDTLASATVPGRCFVVTEREGKVIWGGLIRTRTYQSQAKVAQLYATSFEDYLSYRFLRSNFTRTTQEQRNIVRDLFLLMQSDPYSIKFDLPAAISSPLVTKSVDVLASELKTFRQVVDSIADGSDGFDWRIVVARDSGVYTRTLQMVYPFLGAYDPNAFWFEYPGNILNYWENETMGEAGTNIFGVGAGEGGTMLLSENVQQSLLNQGFPRYDVDVSYKDVNSQAVLNTVTAQAGTIRRAPRPVITAEIKGDQAPVFGSYDVGDACTILLQDGKHPYTGGFKRTTRVLGWEYYPPSDDSVEMARLTFEGDDL